MATERGRVFVGVDGSLCSLRALRQAVLEARQRHAELHAVHVRRPASPASRQRIGFQERSWLDRRGEGLIVDSFLRACGGIPADLTQVRTVVTVGAPAAALVRLGWRDDDLIVIGAHGRHRWRHVCRRSVSRYCLAHARCPVLVVPPDGLARAVAYRSWLTRSRAARDPWKDFDATTGSDYQHIS